MRIDFGPWLPDLPDNQNPGLTVATNVLPDTVAYKAFNDLTASTDALTGRAKGLYGTFTKSGASRIFAGDETKLYRLSSGAWDDATRTSGGAYATATDGWWDFATFGDLCIAVNGVDAPQKFDMSSATDFAALGGSPPVAKYVAVSRGFVVLGNISSEPQRVRWSAIEDAETWPTVGTQTAVTLLSDQVDLLGDGGAIQRVIGGDYITVFQERSIWRGVYVGAPAVWQFDEVERGQGTPSPMSVVRHKDAMFYLADDGFCIFDGHGSRPIGQNMVDEFFFSDVKDSALWAVNATIDPINRRVFWAYPSKNAADTVPDRIMVYHWPSQRWAVINIDIQVIGVGLSEGWTLEQIGAAYTNLDTSVPYSLDSRFWAGGEVYLAGFDTDNKLGAFEGSVLAGTLETAEMQPAQGRKVQINGFRPIADGTITGQLAYRDRLADSVTWTSATSMTASGRVNQRASGRYFRARLNLSSWTSAQGIEVEEPDVQVKGVK